ncbi:hypothetical protein ACFX2B_018108 [Malus domestica]
MHADRQQSQLSPPPKFLPAQTRLCNPATITVGLHHLRPHSFNPYKLGIFTQVPPDGPPQASEWNAMA